MSSQTPTPGAALQALRNTKSGGRNGGRPRAVNRCPCGKYTASLAAKRGHKCATKAA